MLAARGITALSDYFDVIVEGAENSDSSVREAYLEVWVYLPKTFGAPLHIYLDQTLPVIINVCVIMFIVFSACKQLSKGLADDKEVVRSMALSAGKSLVTAYAIDHFTIFLPVLQEGLCHKVWRVREHACVLVGDVLARICGAQVM